MGVKNLIKVLKEIDPNIESEIHINDIKGKRVAIDAHFWLYQLVTAVRRSNGDDLRNDKGKAISHLHGLLLRIAFMMRNQIKPIFVFDGVPPNMKNKTLEKRANIKLKAQEEFKDKNTSDKRRLQMFQRMTFIDSKMIKECIELLNILGIPYVMAPEEADSQCAYLLINNFVDFIISDDSDILAFGGKSLVRGFKVSIKKFTILNSNQSQNKIIDLAVLLGCDYCNGIKGVGVKTAIKIIKDKTLIELLDELVLKNKITNEEKQEKIKAMNYFRNPPIKVVREIQWKPTNMKKLDKFCDELSMTRNKPKVLASAKKFII